MSLPAPNHPVWLRLATGALTKLKTQNLGIQLMTKRLERAKEPTSAKAVEVHDFFVKFERVLQAEIQQLPSL